MAKTHRYTAQQVIEALQATHGMVYLAAQQLKCNPQTVMNYCKKFPSVEQAKHDARGAILDEAELRLLAAIRRDEAWAIAFYLKTVGRSRGYGERLDLNVSIQAVGGQGGGGDGADGSGSATRSPTLTYGDRSWPMIPGY